MDETIGRQTAENGQDNNGNVEAENSAASTLFGAFRQLAGGGDRQGIRGLLRDRRQNMMPSEKIDDVGVIDDYELPKGFKKTEDIQRASFDIKEYQMPANPTMKIAYWNWNKPSATLPLEVSKSWKEILEQKPHKLDAREVDSLTQVFPAGLYGYNGNYDILDMRTETLDGQKVLVMENQWRDDDRKTYGIFIPSDKTASHVEHLHFEASKADFRKHWPQVRKSFHHIDLEN